MPGTIEPTDLPDDASNRRGRVIQRVFEVLVSLVFLLVALRGIRLGELWGALRDANYLWLLPGIVITVGLLVLKAWRWQLLFLPDSTLPFGSVFTALCAGYLASNVLPARVGEVVRLVLLVSEQPVSIARTASSIVVERLLDVLTLLVILVALLPFVQLPAQMTRAAQALGWLALAGAALMVVISFWKTRILGWVRRLLGRVPVLDRPVVHDTLAHLIDGFALLRGRLGLMLVLISLISWGGVAAVAWTAAQAVGLAVPTSAIVFAVIVSTLGMLLPSSPGYIGVFHAAVVLALEPFQVPKDLAFTFALVWHAVNYLTLSGAGVAALMVHGTSLGQVLARWLGRE